MKIALLIDSSTVAQWQAEAIRQIHADTTFLVYNCTNSKPGRRLLRHGPYYVLNLLSLRSDWTRKVPIAQAVDSVRPNDFECASEGGWEKLPRELISTIERDRPDMIVKFGMGLLKVPDAQQLRIPILSFHHGDPRSFRGRPAGFYEMLHGEAVVAQIVQILSNRLDAGRVVAIAETKVRRHSYRATMREAYAVSPLLLPKAVRAVMDGRTLDIGPAGKIYRLPHPLTVLRFALQRSWAKLAWLAYGALIEKAWQVAETPRSTSPEVLTDLFPASGSWRVEPTPRGYLFVADPFYHPAADGILVEAFKLDTGLGEILHLSHEPPRRLLAGRGHFSYPATFRSEGKIFLVPETCKWSPPTLFELDGSKAVETGLLKLPYPCRLVDPTLFERDGTTYLFANLPTEAGTVLRLWTSKSVLEPFEEHPDSPILISPAGARMGGAIIECDRALYRVGQDGRHQYGDGIILFRIDQLSPSEYREQNVRTLRFKDVHGPHTLNLARDRMVFDFYRNRFALLAGFRRLRGQLSGRAKGAISES
jgi:hypothetical protein